MPGFILHLTEAKLICESLERKGMVLDEDWKNRFFLGNLLPDTKRKPSKAVTHFWDQEQMKYWAIPPNVRTFEEMYGAELKDPLMFGYWSHLWLDYHFVVRFWEEILEFHGEDGKIDGSKATGKTVLIKHFGKEVPITEFFSDEYYYGDYTRMNDYFERKYRLEAPKYVENMRCPVREADVRDLKGVLDELELLMGEAKEVDERELKVFSIKSLETFIRQEAEIMAEKIPLPD